ncbi:MAG TPA: tRNA pseudouridine(55) synthase TruB [Stellaceae bacterium]|nr:tRNA pseudouridine(55) synthase TruB [Stellaceae bacterium]
MTAEHGRHGWVVIDKPSGITSSNVVVRLRRSAGIKAGHAGTLDPLATGVLPVALGEATKTVSFVSKATKLYRFRVQWGIDTDTDDREGKTVAESPVRPDAAAITSALARFTGSVLQRPPAYSAIKIAGRRAYALARAGEAPRLAERRVTISELRLVSHLDRDHAEFEAVVGEGTYIRSLARDLAQALGTCGHVTALRRLAVGRFTETQGISLDLATSLGHSLLASGHVLPIEAALDDIPALTLTADEAARLRHGQPIVLTECEGARLDRLDDGTIVGARHGQLLVGLARIENGRLQPVRIINER